MIKLPQICWWDFKIMECGSLIDHSWDFGRNTEDEWLSLILEDGNMEIAVQVLKVRLRGTCTWYGKYTGRAGQRGLEEHVESFQKLDYSVLMLFFKVYKSSIRVLAAFKNLSWIVISVYYLQNSRIEFSSLLKKMFLYLLILEMLHYSIM